RRAVHRQTAKSMERTALETERQGVRQSFFQANMDHAEAGKVAILGAERAVQDINVIHQLWNKSLQRPQIALAVSLRTLVLLYVIDQDFQASVHSAVIQVEPKTPDLQRFSPTFMLAGVDAGGQRVENLVITIEECVAINRLVPLVNHR